MVRTQVAHKVKVKRVQRHVALHPDAELHLGLVANIRIQNLFLTCELQLHWQARLAR